MVTKEDLKSALIELGIKNGMTLEVHSSLSSFGKLEGGAMTLIDTLKELVTEEGSIFMPALRLSKELPLTDEDKKLGITVKIKVLPREEKRTAMGIVADTFRMLHERGLRMEPKAFAAGVRIEHPQAMIDLSQYGRPQDEHLGPAPYKLTHTAADGRGVYSFCMCPGGYVVNASSEKGLLAVNGMSYMKRDSANANSAILVTVTPEYFMPMRPDDLPDALAGTAFQAELEKKAYAAAGGRIPQQLYSDFMNKTASSNYGEFASCVRGGAAFADLNAVLPSFMARDIGEGISAFGKKIRGFDRPDAILSGIESRSSSPVRITRDEKYVSNIDGIYPCGEGCGYAGGITSASMDGMRCAEAIIKRFRKLT